MRVLGQRGLAAGALLLALLCCSYCLDGLTTDTGVLGGIRLIRRTIDHQLASLSQALHAHTGGLNMCTVSYTHLDVYKRQR